MSSTGWEPASVKAQLRLTTLRLGQLQEKKDSQGAIIRRDIATLLQQRNVGLARAKAQTLQREDALGDLLEVLEMHVGQLLEHFNELDQCVHLGPNVVEAASTVIYAAPHVLVKDLDITSNLLEQHLGPEFTRSAMTNHDGNVAKIAIRTTTAPPPALQDLDLALQKIASEYGVNWTPEPSRQDILNLVSEILDPQSSPIVDLPALRRLCRHGIPDEPKWLRPRDLTRRLLDPFSALPLPTPTTNPLDAALINVSEQLSAIPSTLFADLDQTPGSFEICPLDDAAQVEIKMSSAKNLDVRLHILHTADSNHSSASSSATSRPPESGMICAPEISLSSPDVSMSGEMDVSTTTLLSSTPLAPSTVHPKHLSALRRLLYLHASINPGNISPHIPSLLVPLYAVLNQEVLPEDLAHVEADTFWLFEALVGEFSELEDEGGSIWMKRFSDRLAWADFELFSALVSFPDLYLSDELFSYSLQQVKGLDPALPHYS
ncbi:hypothetical protein C0991_004209 [Blastosporella zonata]|nr:hypothetical protein C0991_004209 [Blastosporella zonata]